MAETGSKGTRGWLLVYVICSLPVVTVYSVGFSGFFLDYPLWLILTITSLLAVPLLLVLLRSPKAPRWNIFQLWTIAVLMIARTVVIAIESGLAVLFPTVAGLIVFSLGWAIVWTGYFRKSVRVRNTFVERHQT